MAEPGKSEQGHPVAVAVKSSLLWALGGILVTVMGVQYGVLNKLYTDVLESEKSRAELAIKKVEAELASMKQQLGGKEALNIFDLYVPDSSNLGQVGCGIYLPKIATCGPGDILEKRGVSSSSSRLSGWNPPVEVDGRDLAKEIYVGDVSWASPEKFYLLRHGQRYVVEDPLGLNAYRNVFAYVTLRSIPLDKFPSSIISEKISQLMVENSLVGKNGARSSVEKLFSDDPLVVLLQAHIWDIYTSTISMPNQRGQIVEATKYRNGLRFRSMLTWSGYHVDGKKLDAFHVLIETFALRRRADVILVTSFVPMTQPNGEGSEYGRVISWTSRLKFLEK